MSERMNKLKNFLEKSPDDSFLKHALALEYLKTGDEITARSLFEQILQTDPGYTGTYYHLGKLLEKQGEQTAAISWYEKGLTASKAAGEQHTYNELKAALDELADF
ncbi:MAG TPA: hypothetical protein VM012_01950 [Flavitalea sp.]|nr:hypothetical protein [Flavitalea sp.]